MTIYKDVQKYAETTMMANEEAEIRCDYFQKQHQEQEEAMERARICPECKKSTLNLESGQYEDGNGVYMEAQCENEECQYSCEDHPHEEMVDVFDVVLMFALQVEKVGMAQIEQQIGSPWTEFVASDTASLTEPPSWE